MSRLFFHNTDHAEVGRYLRAAAKKGFQKGLSSKSKFYVETCTCGVNLPEYPKSISLTLTRDSNPEFSIGWHLSVCCVTDTGYRGYVPEEGEHWKEVIFGLYSARAIAQPLEDRGPIGIEKDVHHWILECDWSNKNDPAVELEFL
jgi:hypothetical protein